MLCPVLSKTLHTPSELSPLRRGDLGLTLIAAVLTAAGCMPMTTLRVSDFGAVGDGKHDDGPAIRKAIETAKELDEPATVRFEPRTYRIGPRYDRWCAFAVEDARDITLDGQGATLLLHPDNRAALIYRSEGIRLRNFVVDFDPLPFTQGDVVAIDKANKEIHVRIHDGFPLPDMTPGRHGAVIEKGRHRYTHLWSYIGAVRPLSREERLYAVSGKKEAGHEDHILRTQVGERFVFPVVYRPHKGFDDPRFIIGKGPRDKGVFHTNPAGTFQVRFSRRYTLENITVHASPVMVVRLTGTQDVTLRNLRLVYKPGSRRLMVGASDGMHCKNSKTGPVIEDCVFEGLLDDSINISTMSEDVMERVSDTEFLTAYSDIAYYDSSVAVGDTLLVFDPVKSVVLDEVQVEEVEFLRSHHRRITIDRAVPGIADAKAAGRDKCTRFFIKKTAPALVRGCTFRSQMKTALLLRTPIVCEGNTVEDTAYGVHACNSFRFGEGPVPYDQVYRGNRFRDVWIAAIQLYRMGHARPLPPGGGPILIEGNTIVQGNGHGIGVHNFRDLTIRATAITMRPDAEANLRAIDLSGCAGVTIEACTIHDPRVTIEGAIRLRGATKTVRLEDNTFRLANGVAELETK